MSWCISELKRVGILDSPVFSFDYGVPSIFNATLCKSLNDKYKCNLKSHYLSYTLQYERVLQQSYALGIEKTLIIEDDCCFLKDLVKLRNALESMPKGFEVFQFDKGMYSSRLSAWNDRCSRNSINDFWCDCTNTPFVLSTANVYTRVSIEKILSLWQTKLCVSDQIAHRYSGKWAIAKENLCIQMSYKNSHMLETCGDNKMHDIYKPIGIDYSDYSVPEGFGYGEVIQ